MARKKAKHFLPFLSLSVLLFAVIAATFSIKKPQIFSPGADTGVELHVRLSKSYVAPGESYIFQAIQRNNAGTPYSGYLDVKATVCNSSGSSCSTSTGTWKNFDGSNIWVNNGAFTVNVPSNFPPSVIYAKWKPKDSTKWSNGNQYTQLNIGTTWGLKDTQKFWIFWTDRKKYSGRNNIYGQNFDAWISHSTVTTACGLSGRWMYYEKSNSHGYWGPRTPWYNRNYNTNFKWFLPSWRRASGWHDTYLTAYGGIVYSPLTQQFSSDGVQKMKFFWNDTTVIPYYILSPRWVQSGYGAGTSRAVVGKISANEANYSTTSMCGVQKTSGEGIWSIHMDIRTLTIKRNNGMTSYNGPALRIKFYEGVKTYRNTSGDNEFLREDYWFIENVGLVRIDTKNFGSRNDENKYTSLKKPCIQDPDCLYHEEMQNPHVTMTRSDYK
jgi:hypothetical protein